MSQNEGRWMVWEAVENGQGINRGNRTVFFHIHDQLLVRITSHSSIQLYFSLLDTTLLLTPELLRKFSPRKRYHQNEG